MAKVKKIFGIAGSGKTTMMAKEFVRRHREAGVELQDMLVLSFTIHAAKYFRQKCREVDEYDGRSFATANIMTIHSFAWRFLIPEDRKKELKFHGGDQYDPPVGGPAGRKKAAIGMVRRSHDISTALTNASRQYKIDGLEEEYDKYMEDMKGRIDYDGLLYETLYVPVLTKKWKLVVVDEIQDLSLIQWNILERHLLRYAEEVWLAGDPSQSIFRWRNAYPAYVNEIPGETIHLTESHRVPQNFIPLIRGLESGLENQTFKSNLTSVKPPGIFEYKHWVETLWFLKQCSDDMVKVLLLTTVNSMFGRIREDMVDHCISFAQATDHPFFPWKPIQTLADRDALLFLRIVEMGRTVDESFWDQELETSRVRYMFKASREWTDRWKLVHHDHPTISVRKVLELLGVDPAATDEELFMSFFGDPGQSKAQIWNAGVKKDKKEEVRHNVSYARMKRYQEKCIGVPFVDPPIRLSTVHSAKGLEEEIVVILLAEDRRFPGDDQIQLLINAVCRSSRHIVVTKLPRDRETITLNNPLSEFNVRRVLSVAEAKELGIMEAI